MFDPYHRWLGIPKDQRPPTYYQLLGISPQEEDPEVIEDAYLRQTAHVRTYQLSEHTELCTRILNELAGARLTLLDQAKRDEYDAKLRQHRQPQKQRSVKAPPASVPSPGSTDSTLLERIRSHDPEAWQQFIELYGPLVYHWCRRSGLQPDDAADVGQEVFQAVAGGISGFRRDRQGDTFRGWLRTITRTKVVDLFRSRGVQPQAVGGSDAHDQFQ